MNLLLGFVFLLCLLLLVMIFGERLIVFGAFHGRWFNALSKSIADSWNLVCKEVDRCWCFIVKHLWWVLAVGSGGSGLMLVAWIIFGAVADRAAADLAGHSGRMHAGGILDCVPDIAPPRELLTATFPKARALVTAHIDQVPSALSRTMNLDRQAERTPGREDRVLEDFLISPDFTGRGLRDYSESQPAVWSFPDRDRGRLPTLKPEQRYQAGRGSPVFSRWNEEYMPDDVSINQISGTTVTSRILKEEIETALAHLEIARHDEWQSRGCFPVSGLGNLDLRSGLPRVREVTYDELVAIESSARIVPGSGIGSSDLQIEKRMLATDRSNEFDIEISVTNLSRQRMSGLLVHEQLPYRLQPVSIDDGGVYRDSTITWVIHDLPQLKSRIVRMRIRSESARTFATQTVVSAVAAIASEIVVQSDRRTEFIPVRPELQVTVGAVPLTVEIAEQLEIPFRISNVGTVTVNEVVLRVELPPGLDHFHLTKNDIERHVAVTVRNLEPSGSCVKILKLRATEHGEQAAVVELLADRRRTDFTSFRVRVRDDNAADAVDGGPRRLEPDDSMPSRRR